MKRTLSRLFAFAVWMIPNGFGPQYLAAGGSWSTLFEEVIDADEGNQWQDQMIDIESFWGQQVELRLETYAGANLLHDHGCRANPRFVIDPIRQ